MRIALVHDWLTGMRGGELVLGELCGLFPDSTIFTLFHHPGSVSKRIESMPIRVSLLNRIPGARRNYRHWLPLYPWAISRFDLSGFDLIISNSHAVAKGVRKPPGSLHICSCLTPMRYIWDMGADYFRYSGMLDMRRFALGLLKHPLRAWDRATAARVDHFIADSRHVQERIARFYGRESEVVYPPVDTDFFTPPLDGRRDAFYLVVSALVPYKRVDLAVDACHRMGRRLVVAGDGPDRRRLEARAGPGVSFIGFVTNEKIRDLYRECAAVIIPGCEDFGLVSLEAQACGCPAIAYSAGGSLETIRENETGAFFFPQTTAALVEAIQRVEKAHFDHGALRAHAERFSTGRFRREMSAAIRRRWSEFAEREGRAGPARSGQKTTGAIEAVGEAEAGEQLHASLMGLSGGVKRTLDVVLSLAGIVVLALPLAIVTWLIRRESAGPGLYRQTRLGLHGRRFSIVKLRTMRQDAETGACPVWASENDPRCTRLGGSLRRFGIDELPQLWNVLKGEMSLVGPRPERPEFHAAFRTRLAEFERRLAVRGGITGLAQIRGWRGDTSIQERLRADLAYIDDWTIWTDVLVLLQTPFTIFRRRPAQGERKSRHLRHNVGFPVRSAVMSKAPRPSTL